MKLEKENNIKNISHLEKLFKSYYKSLCVVSFNIVKDNGVAEDVVQDMFLNIWNKKNELNIKSSLKSYLFKSTVNTALNYVKANKKKFPSHNEPNTEVICSSNSTENYLLERDIKERLTESINKLPKKCKMVFMLSRFEGMKYKEISKKLNISIKTVENQMGKALKRIRRYMSAYLPEEISKRKLI